MKMLKNVLFGFAILTLAACQGGNVIEEVFPKAESPISADLIKKMKTAGMTNASPIMLRIFKTEGVIEVWKQNNTGRYALLSTYEICKWSGKLGPKFKEGDRQAPEGFYTVNSAQLNPASLYHLSFNIGFPNIYDRSHGRTGTNLMVHGACSSAGCYSMTDDRIEEIYALAREALNGGQESFQVQAYPFRMTVENMAKNAANEHFEFWKMLKEGYDHFELTKLPPKVDVCDQRYVFNRIATEGSSFSSRKVCPPVTMTKSVLVSYAQFRQKENEAFLKLLKREKARAKFRGGQLASMDVSGFNIIPKGEEVLPPATPVEQAAQPVIAAVGSEVTPAVQGPANAGINSVAPSVAAGEDLAAQGASANNNAAKEEEAVTPAAGATLETAATAVAGENLVASDGGTVKQDPSILPANIPVPTAAPDPSLPAPVIVTQKRKPIPAVATRD